MKIIPAVIAVALVGCVAGREQVEVTRTQVVTFPGVVPDAHEPSATDARATDALVKLDMHQDLAALRALGSLVGTFSTNSLSGPGLADVTHVRVTIATTDGALPVRLLSEADVPGGSRQVELPLSMTGDQVLDYLAEGEVEVHFYITGGIPPSPIALTHTLDGRVNVAVEGSVLGL